MENSVIIHSVPGYIHLDTLGTESLAMLEPATASSDKDSNQKQEMSAGNMSLNMTQAISS